MKSKYEYFFSWETSKFLPWDLNPTEFTLPNLYTTFIYLDTLATFVHLFNDIYTSNALCSFIYNV